MYKQEKTTTSLINITFIFILLFFTLTTNASIKRKTIVGGKEASPHSYPFIVSVQFKKSGRHYCGGSLISPSTVITAAHCTKNQSAENIRVVISEHDLATKEGPEQIRDISKIIVHKGFKFSNFKDDISIIQLTEPVNLDAKAQLITLPEVNEEFAGTNTVIGWGAMEFGGDGSDKLNEVDVDIDNFDKCNEDYDGKILPGMICASSPGKDACQGDSGGPLFKDNKLIGLTSWGYGCANPKFPGVYTEVSKYIDFITENILW